MIFANLLYKKVENSCIEEKNKVHYYHLCTKNKTTLPILIYLVYLVPIKPILTKVKEVYQYEIYMKTKKFYPLFE